MTEYVQPAEFATQNITPETYQDPVTHGEKAHELVERTRIFAELGTAGAPEELSDVLDYVSEALHNQDISLSGTLPPLSLLIDKINEKPDGILGLNTLRENLLDLRNTLFEIEKQNSGLAHAAELIEKSTLSELAHPESGAKTHYPSVEDYIETRYNEVKTITDKLDFNIEIEGTYFSANHICDGSINALFFSLSDLTETPDKTSPDSREKLLDKVQAEALDVFTRIEHVLKDPRTQNTLSYSEQEELADFLLQLQHYVDDTLEKSRQEAITEEASLSDELRPLSTPNLANPSIRSV